MLGSYDSVCPSTVPSFRGALTRKASSARSNRCKAVSRSSTRPDMLSHCSFEGAGAADGVTEHAARQDKVTRRNPIHRIWLAGNDCENFSRKGAGAYSIVGVTLLEDNLEFEFDVQATVEAGLKS